MSKRPDVRVRNMTLDDVPRILELEKVCFPRIPADRHWQPDQVEAHVKVFKAGQWVAVRDGEVVGSAMNLRVRLADALKPHTWRGITGTGRLGTHHADGDALYGTEIMVHPDTRRQGIGRRLYQARKDYVIEGRLKAFVSGGRIPNYGDHAATMTPEEYVAKVVAGELADRVLTPQLKAGMRVAGILPGYLTDPPSHNFATLLVWRPYEALARAPGNLDEVGRGP